VLVVWERDLNWSENETGRGLRTRPNQPVSAPPSLKIGWRSRIALCIMNKYIKGYYSQDYYGQIFSLEVEEVLHHEKSQYQDILVFKR